MDGNLKRRGNMDRLASRKLWVSIGTIVTVLVSASSGMPWQGQVIVAALGMVYVIAQAFVDARNGG